MKRRHDNSGGFTLVELMAYMALFGVILSVIYSTYYQFSRTVSAAEITMLKERQAFSAIRWIQDDFRRSKNVLVSFGPFGASGECLILNIPGGGDSANEVVIYKHDVSGRTLTRYHYEAGQSETIPSSLVVGKGIMEFKYSFEKEKEHLLRVSFGLTEGPLGAFSNRPLHFAVARRNESGIGP